MLGGAWQKSNWLDILALPFAAAVMRVAWVYPLLAIMTSSAIAGTTAVLVPAWLLLAFAFGSTVLAHLASDTPEGYIIVILSGFAACLTMLLVAYPLGGMSLGSWISGLGSRILYWNNNLPAPAILLIATALLWWRGMATRNMDHTALTASFATGGVMMIIVLGLLRIFPPALSDGRIFVSVVMFLMAGLATLALAGASQAMKRSERDTGMAVHLSRHWLLAVAAVIGAVLVVGWLISLVVAPEGVRQVLDWLRPVWQLLGTIVYYILYPFIYLIFLLLGPLLDWFEGRQQRPQEGEPSAEATETLEAIEQVAREIPPALDFSLRAVLLVAAVLLFIWLVVRTLRRISPGRKPELDESREGIWSWGLMRDQLASLLRRARQAAPIPLFWPFSGNLADPRLVIREAYRRLLALAVERGKPRARRDTPYAYLDKLGELAPENREDLRALTDAYVAARYDPAPPSSEQARAAEEALQRVRAAVQPAGPAGENNGQG